MESMKDERILKLNKDLHRFACRIYLLKVETG